VDTVLKAKGGQFLHQLNDSAAEKGMCFKVPDCAVLYDVIYSHVHVCIYVFLLTIAVPFVTSVAKPF
jgi:hypothetical protein